MDAPVIIGGGITGLVRALVLIESGVRPILIESAAGGGLIRSVEKEGFTFECGAATLTDTPDLKSLVKKLGLESKVRFPIVPNYRQYIWYAGAAHSIPKGPLQLLRSKLFPIREKIAAIRGVFKSDLEISERMSVSAFFSKIFSTHIAMNIVAPALRGIFGGDAEQLLAARVFPKIFEHLNQGGSLFSFMRTKKAGGKRKIFCLDGGNQQLTDGLLALIKDRCDVRANTVTRIAPGATSSQYTVTLNSGEILSTSSITIATAGHATAQFVAPISAALAENLAAIRYAPIAVLHFALPSTETLLTDGFGVLFAPNEATAPLGILFNSQLFPHTAPAGEQLVTVCYGGVANEAALSKSDAELVADATAAMNRYLNIKSARLLSLVRWQRAIPQYDSVSESVLTLMSEVEAQFSGIRFLGADRGGVGVPARVEAAMHS